MRQGCRCGAADHAGPCEPGAIQRGESIAGPGEFTGPRRAGQGRFRNARWTACLRLDPDNPDTLGCLRNFNPSGATHPGPGDSLAHPTSPFCRNDPQIAIWNRRSRRRHRSRRTRRSTPPGAGGAHRGAVALTSALFQGPAPPATLAVKILRYAVCRSRKDGGTPPRAPALPRSSLPRRATCGRNLLSQLLTLCRDQTRTRRRPATGAAGTRSRRTATAAGRGVGARPGVDPGRQASQSPPAYQAWLADGPTNADISGQLEQARCNPPRAPVERRREA